MRNLVRNIIIAAVLSALSFCSYADKSQETYTYTVQPTEKYFRLDCERHSYVYATSYTINYERNEITLVDDDGEFKRILNNECLITTVKK